MKIAINCRSFLKGQNTGIGRYAYNLVRELTAIDRANHYQLYARKNLFAFNKKLPDFNAPNVQVRVDRFGRGPAKILKGADIYHCPSPGPLEAPDRAKIVVTVHDVIFKAFPDGHTEETIRTGQSQFEEIVRKAAKVICCSKATVNDLQTFFQIPSEKIRLVYQGVDKTTFYPVKAAEERTVQRALREKGVEGPYILAVGTIEPRKNLINLIKAFNLLVSEGKFKGQLVIIGMKGWMEDGIGRLIEEFRLDSSICLLGYVNDAALRYFYNKAEVFVFPSLYEGFGFPIVEAFSCGAPVVTSNVSACPEIAGNAALTVDPKDPHKIAGAIESIVCDQGLRAQLIASGLKRAQAFDFRKTAEATLRVYEEVYGDR